MSHLLRTWPSESSFLPAELFSSQPFIVASPKLLAPQLLGDAASCEALAMTSTASIESLLEGLGLEDTPTYGDYVRGMLDDVDVASLDAQIDEVVAYLAEVLGAPAASLGNFASALREVWTNPRAASAVAEAAALADDAAPPPADEARPATRPRPPRCILLGRRGFLLERRRRLREDDEAAALKAATLALARRAGRPARNDLPTVDNKERERQKLKQVIKDHHQERRADYRAKRDARLEREAEMERQKNHRLNLTNSAAVRGAAVAREERAAQHRGFKEAALKRRQKQMPD